MQRGTVSQTVGSVLALCAALGAGGGGWRAARRVRARMRSIVYKVQPTAGPSSARRYHREALAVCTCTRGAARR
jgi:hypothetical protein